METGWPPPPLLVMVTMTIATRAPSEESRICCNDARSTLPLNGAGSSRSRASGHGMSRASHPASSMLARVVSKCVLLSDSWPGRNSVENRIRSAALPWCTGRMWG